MNRVRGRIWAPTYLAGLSLAFYYAWPPAVQHLSLPETSVSSMMMGSKKQFIWLDRNKGDTYPVSFMDRGRVRGRIWAPTYTAGKYLAFYFTLEKTGDDRPVYSVLFLVMEPTRFLESSFYLF